MTMTVHVRLLDEAVHVWRPVLAEPIHACSYLLVPSQSVPDGEIWEFQPGQYVAVERRELSGGEALVAVAEAQVRGSAADLGKAPWRWNR